MWYNVLAETNRIPGRFAFQNAVGTSQFYLVGKAPFMCGLTSPAVRLSNDSAHGGRFVMGKFIDETGKRYGQLTVLERHGSNDQGHATWLCLCDCGNEAVVPGANLRRGHTVGCGCQQNQLIDEVGNRYGRLTVIKRAENHPDFHNTQWLCQCDCGEQTVVQAGNLRAGSVTGCGCRHPLPEGEAAFNAKYSQWKHRAKKKGLRFSLTKGLVYDLSQQECFYCGVPPLMEQRNPHGNGSFVYNGLDRVDNKRGYTIDNVVPCCGTCNHAKATLGQEDFRNLVCRIYHHWAKDCD